MADRYLLSVPVRWNRYIVPSWGRRGPRRHGLRGAAAFSLLYMEIRLRSGSGSNTWRTELVLIDKTENHRDSWTTVPVPDKPYPGKIGPGILTSAELPFSAHYRIPRHLAHGELGIQFERAGAGTCELEVTMWTSR